MPKTQETEFESNTQVMLSLDAAPAVVMGGPGVAPPAGRTVAAVVSAAPVASPPSVPTAPTNPTTKPTDINPQGGTAPLHKIDPNNPYGN